MGTFHLLLQVLLPVFQYEANVVVLLWLLHLNKLLNAAVLQLSLNLYLGCSSPGVFLVFPNSIQFLQYIHFLRNYVSYFIIIVFNFLNLILNTYLYIKLT